jgi:hypothetical protein
VGSLLALAMLLPLSLAFGGGVDAWTGFARNIVHHNTTPTINAVGLGTWLSWDPEARLTKLEQTTPDPGRAWKDARILRAAGRWPLRAGLAVCLLAATLWAARREESWAAAALGVGLIPVLLDPSSYYTGIFLAYGLLWTSRPSIGAGLCALSAFGWLAVAGGRGQEQGFAWISAAMLALVGLAAGALLRGSAPDPERSARTKAQPD